MWKSWRWELWREGSGARTETRLRATIVLLSAEAVEKMSDRCDDG